MQSRVRFLKEHRIPIEDSPSGNYAGAIHHKAGQTYHVAVAEAAELIRAGIAEHLSTPFPQRDDDGTEVTETDARGLAAQAEIADAVKSRELAAHSPQSPTEPPATAPSIDASATPAKTTSRPASEPVAEASTSSAVPTPTASSPSKGDEEPTAKIKKSGGGA